MYSLVVHLQNVLYFLFIRLVFQTSSSQTKGTKCSSLRKERSELSTLGLRRCIRREVDLVAYPWLSEALLSFQESLLHYDF